MTQYPTELYSKPAPAKAISEVDMSEDELRAKVRSSRLESSASHVHGTRCDHEFTHNSPLHSCESPLSSSTRMAAVL